MRIWDVGPEELCRSHLLGEHRELHGLWNVLTLHEGQGGYARHPETLRWVGKTRALYRRHEALIREFHNRGYRHASPLEASLAGGSSEQDALIDDLARQRRLLAAKPCDCPFGRTGVVLEPATALPTSTTASARAVIARPA